MSISKCCDVIKHFPYSRAVLLIATVWTAMWSKTEVGRPRGNSLSASLLFGFIVAKSKRSWRRSKDREADGKAQTNHHKHFGFVESNLRVSSTLPFRVFRSHTVCWLCHSPFSPSFLASRFSHPLWPLASGFTLRRTFDFGPDNQ